MRIFLVSLLCAAALFAAGEKSNRRAPGWALPDTEMAVHDLADYHGKLVLLEFMKTDCPHCATFAEVLNEVQAKYGDKLVILSVVNSQQDNQNTVAQFMAGHKSHHLVLFDAGQMAFSYFQSISFDNPHIFLIDGTGYIRNDFGYGPLTKEIFEGKALFAEIDRLLAAPASRKK